MPVTVIAEAGVNHNGDIGRALAMVDAAAAANADVVKFQTFRAAELVTATAPKAEYQKANDGDGGQLGMLERLELSEEAHRRLMQRCDERGIEFLSTPFDLPSLAFLTDGLGLATLKLPSGEITNGPLLLAAARTGRRIILSTGMSTLDEVRDALGALAFGYTQGDAAPSRRAFALAMDSGDGRRALTDKVVLLHCTTEYPAPVGEANLRAMATLTQAFGLPVGFSDHTPGIAASIAAAALGAGVIEKHFTLDRGLPGPDHRASLEPAELAALVEGVHQAAAALGTGVKRPAPSEVKNMAVARKSLVALCVIRAGEPLTEANMGVKRPGTGLSPMDYWTRLGQAASRDYAPGEAIEYE
ncbi:MAG: N-acetylneuraminate synthase [Magnetospirillum sp.]|nr:N-acetylneuraminate synthase [Magnetospirillum sp.]